MNGIRRRTRWLAALLVGCAVVSTGACSRGEGGRRQALVLLLDGLRADRLSCNGYGRETTPSIDALASEGTVFRNAWAQATTTRESIPCLLYSRYFTVAAFPFGHEAPLERPEDLFRTFDRECLSLPKAFEASGFVTAGMSAHNWTKASTRIASEFGEWHDLGEILGRGELGVGPGAEQVVDYVLGWLEDYRERDFLLWVHLVDTSFPMEFGQDAAELLGSAGPMPERFDTGGVVLDPPPPLEPEDQAWLDALYDGRLRATDRALGRLLARLEGSELLEHGVVAVVSDHGQGLMDSGVGFGEGVRWSAPLARVPMILAGGRVPAGEVAAPVGLVDLYPTLAGLFDLELPERVRLDGIDPAPSLPWPDGSGVVPGRDFVAAESGIVAGGWKALFNGGARRVLGERKGESPMQVSGVLVDLESDAGESVNLRREEPQRWVRMVELYRQHLDAPYERYLAATTTRTPESPFAVGVFNFEFDRKVPRGPRELKGNLRPQRDPEGWTTNPKWPHYYLLGHGDPEPLELAFAVPDGAYELELHMTGRCLVQLPGESAPRLGRARPFYTRRPEGAVTVPLGAIDLRGGRFEARFEVDPESPYFYLRSIGFRPIAAASATERPQDGAPGDTGDPE